jgi:hypothetical protein
MAYEDDLEDDEDQAEYEPQPRPKAKSSRTWTCLIVALGGGFLLVAIVCCGGGGLLGWFGMSIVSAEIEAQLRDNPTLKEHIGEIESFQLNFVKSAAENNQNSLIFEVKGTKGSGEITVMAATDPNGKEIIQSAELRLADGQKVQLAP